MVSEFSLTSPAHLPKMSFAFNRVVKAGSQILELGKIQLNTRDSNLLFLATSGLPGFQDLNSTWLKGKGRIPTCKQASISSYYVSTQPIPLLNVKGVNGNFYPISPFEVKAGTKIRSDLGIHRDANVPGSAGCLVITSPEHWIIYESQMKKLLNDGVKRVSLTVS